MFDLRFSYLFFNKFQYFYRVKTYDNSIFICRESFESLPKTSTRKFRNKKITHPVVTENNPSSTFYDAFFLYRQLIQDYKSSQAGKNPPALITLNSITIERGKLFTKLNYGTMSIRREKERFRVEK